MLMLSRKVDECKPLVAGAGEPARRHPARHGEAVQFDSFKPKFKPLELSAGKLKCEMLLSTFAFKSNLRRYFMTCIIDSDEEADRAQLAAQAGAYTRPLLSST